MPQEDLAPPQSTAPLPARALKVCVVILALTFALTMVFALILFRVYGVDTNHASRSSIWWPERGRNLIPPAATDITLQRDLLDHYATYTVSEKDLNAFLDKRFARDGKALDSFAERERPDPRYIGNAIGRFGWVVTEETVVYSYTASNGGVHTYYHDPTTGQTYQSSAYW